MPPPTDREALVALLAEQARSDASPSGAAAPEPEPEELLDYLAGRLPPEEAQRIERLLVASPEAARALLDLAELEAAGTTAGERPAELAAVAGWRDLRSRLPGARPSRRRLPPWLSTIAASLLLVTVGGLGWKVRSQGEELSRQGEELSRQEQELSRPIVNPMNVEFHSKTRASEEMKSYKLSPGTPFRVVFDQKVRCPLYTAELTGPGGDAQTIEGLKRDEQGRIAVTWPRGLEPGDYGLRLLGCEPRRELQENRFQIVRSP